MKDDQSSAKGGSGSSTSREGRAVRVAVRVRPRRDLETEDCLIVDTKKNVVSILAARDENTLQDFPLDSCYGPATSQEEIFDRDVKPLLENALEGVNATVFAYGMTGAGKTFTIEGTAEQPGIVVNSMLHLVHPRTKLSRQMDIFVSFFEIYLEQVVDLLAASRSSAAISQFGNNSRGLAVRESADGRITVADLTTVKVNTYSDFQRAYQKAAVNRSVAATNLNAHSSRSHLVIQISLNIVQKTRHLRSKINLVDLAGSENNKRTGNKDQRLKESGSINKSLFVLGQVVDALNTQQVRIPYRESKMTRILQDSLGGTANALIIANIAAARQYHLETLSTLQFAAKSRKIINRPVTHAIDTSTTVLMDRKSDLDRRQTEHELKHKRKRTSEEAVAKDHVFGNENEFAPHACDVREMKERIRKLEEKFDRPVQTQSSLVSKLMPPKTPSRSALLQSKDSVDSDLSTMTPSSKAAIAQSFFRQGENLRRQKKYQPAIVMYEHALSQGGIDQKEKTRIEQRIATSREKLAELRSNLNATESSQAANSGSEGSRSKSCKSGLGLPVSPISSIVSTSKGALSVVDEVVSDQDIMPIQDAVRARKQRQRQLHVIDDTDGVDSRSNSDNCDESNGCLPLFHSYEYEAMEVSRKDKKDSGRARKRPSNGDTEVLRDDQVITALIHSNGDAAAQLLEILNSGRVDRVSQLNGIGHRRAQQIVDHCHLHGRLESVHALQKIPGFGPKMLQKLLCQ